MLNIGGNFFYYNYSRTPQAADGKAIRSDWQMVGQDIRNGMKQYDPLQTELPLVL